MTVVRDMGKIITVRGPIEPDELGITLMHEHLLFDFVDTYYVEAEEEEQRNLGRGPIVLSNRGVLYRNPFAISANLKHDSIVDAAREALAFKDIGGSSIVEQTPIGCGRDPVGLLEISTMTDLHIIASSGFYIAAGHPRGVRMLSLQELADTIIQDLVNGMDRTQIRAGFLGDLGTTSGLLDDEVKCLRAAAIAHLHTGAAMGVHLDPSDRQAMKVIGLLTTEGVRPDRIVLEHLDEPAEVEPDYLLRIAAEGVYMEFDGWGSEFYYGPPWNVVEPRDRARAVAVKRLIDAGHVERVLITHDIWLRQQMKTYGGDGFDCLFRYGLPTLREAGVADADIQTMLVDNPRRLLALSL